MNWRHPTRRSRTRVLCLTKPGDSIIGGIAWVDRHQLPEEKGFTSLTHFLTGYTDAEQQRMRDELLNTRVQDFHAFAEAMDGFARAGRIVVLGSPDASAKANAARPGLLQVTPVL